MSTIYQYSLKGKNIDIEELTKNDILEQLKTKSRTQLKQSLTVLNVSEFENKYF